MNETVLYTQNDNLSEEAKVLRSIFAPGSWGAKLLTPVSKASFYSHDLANAFKQFPENADLGETFTLVELLSCAELLYGHANTVAKEGDAVYVLLEPVKDLHLMASLMRNSVPGICALLQATHGIELSVPVGMDFERFLQGRFLILRQKDGERSAPPAWSRWLGSARFVRDVCVWFPPERFLQTSLWPSCCPYPL